MKKILALVVAMILVLGMTSAFATTITINRDTSSYDDVVAATDQTALVAYKILDASYSSNTTTAGGAGTGTVSYSISTTSPWYYAVSHSQYLTVTDTTDATIKTVSLKANTANSEATARSLASELAAYIGASSNGITTNTTDDVEENGVTIPFGTATTVTEGYYLITATNGPVLVLATTDVQMTEKNDYIKDVKVVEKADIGIGEDATYYIKVYLPSNIDTTQHVIVHDQMDAVLQFNSGSIEYKEFDSDPNSNDAIATYTAMTGFAKTNLGLNDDTKVYNVKTGTLSPAADDFQIDINPATLAGKWIVFKFTATLLQDAVDSTGYVNKEFSTHADYETQPSQPKVYNFKFDVDKDFFNGQTKLNETTYKATFELRDSANTTVIKLKRISATQFKIAQDQTATAVALANAGDGDIVDKFEITNGTNITIIGVDEGDYYLREVATTDGFNPAADTKVTITDTTTDPDTEITWDVFVDNGQTAATDDTVVINNFSGTALPSTGGIGTTLFYIGGGLLALIAVVLLVTKRRMSSND